MHWRTYDLWKAAVVIGGVLFLVLMALVTVSVANARGGVSEAYSAGTVTVQATPTEDATVTALAKEQLTLQVRQLQNQNNWFANNSTALIAAFAAIVVALFGILQWAANLRDERRKEVAAQDKDLRAQAEERFQAAVAALGDERESTQLGGAILLRSFLNKDDKEIYGRYYAQIFDLAVAYLRFRKTSDPREDPLSQALIMVFKEVLPLVRNKLIADGADREGALHSLDASRIQLEHASLREADLRQVWMPQASLRKAILYKADLTGARLKWADLTGVKLLEALSLQGTDLRGVKGLTREQLEACKAKGAFFDVHPRTGLPWSPASPPASSQQSS